MKLQVILNLFVVCVMMVPSAFSVFPEKPDIVWIVADDLGYADVGFTGLTDYKTPHIDQLASAGVICRNGHAMHPFCGPSRAAMMSGRYQQRFSFYGNPLPPQHKNYDPELGIPDSEETIAEVLNAAGYRTAAIGKWHLGSEKKFHPLSNGFTDYFGFLEGHSDYYKTDIRWQSRDEEGQWTEQPPAQTSRTLYMTDLLSDEAVQLIRNTENDQPLFLYLAYNAPHTPMQATQQWLDRVDHIEDPMRRIYAAMVTAMDDGIGKVMAELKRTGRYENTLIFFMSDNGGIEVFGSDNGPWSGMKGTLLEGGIHVPFSITWPARLSAGTEFNEPVIAIDAYATSVAAAGAVLPEGADGLNLIPSLTGDEPLNRSAVFWQTGGAEQWAVQAGDLKLYHVAGLDDRMFRLDVDPGEVKPLLPDERLRALYRAWAEQLPPQKIRTDADFKWPEQSRSVGLQPSKAELKRLQNRDKSMNNLLKKALPKK